MRKIGFFSLVALVVSSQIGVGIFMLPGRFAQYGSLGLFGWVIAGVGAMLLAFVFAELCGRLPRSGGPHVYVRQAFGDTAAFFTGWAYWLISSVGSVVLLLVGVVYLMSMIVECSPATILYVQFVVISLVTCLNCFGGSAVGKTELFFFVLKIIPIMAIPVAGILVFNPDHFIPFNPTLEPWPCVLQKVSLIAMWGFTGVESATIPAASVINAAKMIPRAIFLGTILVITIYLTNVVGIMALVPSEILQNSIAPYSEASKILFQGKWPILSLILPVTVGITCIGNLNAWTLSSSYVAYSLASDSLFPRIFLKKNRFGAPYVSIFLGYLVIVLFTVFCMNQNFKEGLIVIIDMAVVTFLIIYALCALAFLKIMLLDKSQKYKTIRLLLGLCALVFCCWGVFSSGLFSIVTGLGLFALGIPMYVYRMYISKCQNS
jgi:APA family basic amino acid/polyamine antiporter